MFATTERPEVVDEGRRVMPNEGPEHGASSLFSQTIERTRGAMEREGNEKHDLCWQVVIKLGKFYGNYRA